MNIGAESRTVRALSREHGRRQVRCPTAYINGMPAICFSYIIHIGETTEIEHSRRPRKEVAVKIMHPEVALQCGPATGHHRPRSNTVSVAIDQPRHDNAALRVDDLAVEAIGLNVARGVNTLDQPAPQKDAPTIEYLCMRDNCAAVNEGVHRPTPRTFMILNSQP